MTSLIGSTMEVSRGNVYVYEFPGYEQFAMDIDLLIEANQNCHFNLISRLPARRLLDKIDISSMETYWLANAKGTYVIQPLLRDITAMIYQKQKEHFNLFIIDGLEQIYEECDDVDALLIEITHLVDGIKSLNSSAMFCIDSLAFEQKFIVKLNYLTQRMEVKQDQEFDSAVLETEDFEEHVDQQIEFELGIDGGPRMAYLSRLPEIGFTREILVKRILQWRRMGIDVSGIEPALSYNEDKAYMLYRAIEEDVRRATELERFIHENQDLLDVTQIAIDMFRIRQLTGLDELEQRYYSLPS